MEFLAFWINPLGLINIIGAFICHSAYKKTGLTSMSLLTVLNIIFALLIISFQLPVLLG